MSRLNSSLLGVSNSKKLSTFNHTFKNFSLKVGAIIETYEVGSENNDSGFLPEYDILVVEQNQHFGATSTIYRNCISMDNLGSLADFFRVKRRASTNPDIKNTLDPLDHDGSKVLLLCIDGNSEKGIIIGGFPDPNKGAVLTEEVGHHMEGEFNGLNFQVNKDGELTVTFKSASNNDGSYIDEEAGGTFVKIEKDGSLEINNNKTEKVRIDKTNSTIEVIADKAITVGTNDSIVLGAGKDIELGMVKLLIDASGSATCNIGKNFELKSKGKLVLQGKMAEIKADSMINIKGKNITVDGSQVMLGVGGMPAVIMNTQFIGTGNLGGPVISTAIGPFSSKIFISS